jgi:hypothetical protein
MSKSLFDTALYWQQQSISTIPLCYRSKYPAGKALIASGFVGADGRATWLPLKEQLPTEQQIRQWFSNGQRYNLALITTDNLVVLDFDTVEDFALWHCWQQEHNPVVLDTYIVTSSRGLHLYYWIQEPFEPIAGQHLPYEIKSHGKLITIPPSVHKVGVPYKGIGHPNGILSVERIEDILTFSPLLIKRRQITRPEPDPWAIKSDKQTKKKFDLSIFPEIRPSGDDGRYFLTHCPFHKHRWNFWLDTQLEIAGCYAGCGQFLFSELAEIL